MVCLEEAKKRILFEKDKDACFLTYNILIILDFYNCYSEEKAFIDYRKLSYLIDFSSSDILTEIIKKESDATSKEKILLKNSHISSSSRQNRLFLIIQSLKQKGIVNILLDKTNPLKNSIYLIKQDLINPIIDKKIFKYEYNNLTNFDRSKSISRVRTIRVTTLLQKIYESKGIKIWES